MKIIEPATLERRSPIYKCESCGRESTRGYLFERQGSNRLSCFCGKDSITYEEHEANVVSRNNA